MKKYYRIAGLTVEMDTFGKTEAQAAAYEIAPVGEADIVIGSYADAFLATHPELSRDSAEYVTTGGYFYRRLIDFNGMMLHSSAVVMDGKAYLFTAPCGTGKSTHAELWKKAFGERAFILNDDKPALRYEDGVFYAYGTPWSGKSDKQVNCRAPIRGIAILSQSERNEIRRASGKEAVFGILSQTLCPKQRESASAALALIERLIEEVPVWALSVNMDVEAATVAHRAMSQEAK